MYGHLFLGAYRHAESYSQTFASKPQSIFCALIDTVPLNTFVLLIRVDWTCELAALQRNYVMFIYDVFKVFAINYGFWRVNAGKKWPCLIYWLFYYVLLDAEV